MLRILTLFLFIGLSVSSTYLSAQALLSSIPHKKPTAPNGFYFPYQDENGAEHILLFPGRFDLRVLYLDADFQLLEEARVIPEDKQVREFKVLNFKDQPRSLILMVSYDEGREFASMIYDKRERSLKNTEVSIPIRFGDLVSSPIIYQDCFLSIMMPREDGQIVLHRSCNGYEMQSDTILLGIERFKDQFKLPETNRLYPISRTSGNDLFSNLAEAKLYLYGSKLYVSIEDIEAGEVQLFSINLADNRLTRMSYPFPRSAERQNLLQGTSLIYEDLILLASLAEGKGLMVDIYECGFAERLQSHHFVDDSAMDSFFTEAVLERNNGERREGEDELHDYLPKSIVCSLEPTAEGDLWFIVGSVRQFSPEMRYVMLATSLITEVYFGGFSSGISYGSGLSFATADGIMSSVDLLTILANRYEKFVYRVGALNAQDLTLQSRTEIDAIVEEAKMYEGKLTPFQRAEAFLLQNEDYFEGSPAQIMFPYKEGLVRGFGTRKQLYLYYFALDPKVGE
ncbi:MAG: hypothetical protein AAF927_06170 [Bacteroidota bacterium]